MSRPIEQDNGLGISEKETSSKLEEGALQSHTTTVSSSDNARVGCPIRGCPYFLTMSRRSYPADQHSIGRPKCNEETPNGSFVVYIITDTRYMPT